MKQNHFLDNILINEPNNYQELEIELNWDKDSNKEAVSINEWEFGVGSNSDPNDGYNILIKRATEGATGGLGVFEGVPYKIVLSNERGKLYDLFDGYIDLASAQFDNGRINAPAREQGQIDWLNDVADSFTFEFLAESLKVIQDSHYIPVPYCINKQQNAAEVMTAALTIFVVIDKIQEQITDLTEKSAEAANPLEATSIPRIIIRIAYIATLMTALVGMITKLYTLLVQPVKYHYGMYVKDLIRIGCEHLGLGFESSILNRHPYNKLLILPEKYNVQENTGFFDGVFGLLKSAKNEQKGYYKGTFGELLRSMKLLFNAKIVLDGGKLYFEKQNFTLSSPKFKVPDLLDARYKWEYNHDDLKATVIVSFAIDQNDRNTIQEYKGTSYQITTIPKLATNKKMLLLKNLHEVRIPYALGKRKVGLNTIEKMVDAFLKVVQAILNVLVAVVNAVIKAANAVISVLNAIIKALRFIGIKLKFEIKPIPTLTPPNFGNLIENRLGLLKMESDFIYVPKLIMIENQGDARNNKLYKDQEALLNARAIYDGFHYFTSFLPQKDHKGNQYLIKKFDDIPFTFSDFETVKNNNMLFDEQGREGEFISLRFNPYKETASGVFKVHQIYTTNLIEKPTEPDGK